MGMNEVRICILHSKAFNVNTNFMSIFFNVSLIFSLIDVSVFWLRIKMVKDISMRETKTSKRIT